MTPQTRPTDDEDVPGTDTRTNALQRLRLPLQALSGVVLLVAAARSASSNRRRAALFAITGGGLLADWVRRSDPAIPNDPEAVSRPGSDEGSIEGTEPEVVAGDDDATDVVESDDDVPAPDVDETDDRM